MQKEGVCVKMEASHVQVCKPHIGVDALTQQELGEKKKKRKEKINFPACNNSPFTRLNPLVFM